MVSWSNPRLEEKRLFFYLFRGLRNLHKRFYTTQNSGVPALVELTFPKPLSAPVLSSHPQLCLVIGQHYRLEIGKGFDSEDLERVVRVLGRI